MPTKNEQSKTDLTFTPVIGIEIHIQLKTETKIFCSCSTDTTCAPNTNICPVCMGLPGALPVLNEQVVKQGLLAGLALNCTPNPTSLFFRKSYFYPDLPKGYQTSQCDLPIVEKGYVDVHDSSGNLKKIRIHHLHLEEDVGKLHHSASDGRLEGAEVSYVDYNRSGLPLAEIVSEPDVASAQEAVEYVTTLRRRIRYSGASDVDLEKGMMRFDANVSLKCSDGRWGRKVEVKNMNSFRALERAIEYEIQRQKKILLDGGEILQETRHWNDAKGITTGSRVKEFYRKFIVDPDLPPLVLSQEVANSMKGLMPEMPDVKFERYTQEYRIPIETATVLTDSRDLAEYFEACIQAGASPLRAANWVKTDVLRTLNERQIPLSELSVSATVLADLIGRIEGGRISTTQARTIFDTLVGSHVTLDEAMQSNGIQEGSVAGDSLSKVVHGILETNADVVAEIRSGADKKGKKLKFLQGLVMKETRGQAQPAEVASLLDSILKG